MPSRTAGSPDTAVRRSLAGVATVALGVGLVVALSPGSASAAGGKHAEDTSAPAANRVVCARYCDGRPASDAGQDRLADAASVFGRTFALHIDDRAQMGWAVLPSGDPTDEIWLDRSFDGGKTWAHGSKLGDTTIPASGGGATTAMYNIDDPAHHATGVIRACGKAGNRPDVACTAWTATARPPRLTTPARGAVDALVKLYDRQTGLWKTTGWWNSANDLTGVIDYALATGDHRYDWLVANTYEKNLTAQGGQFTNDYIDDTGWWALAWIRAYDLTHNPRYLQTAKYDIDYMWSYRDDHCGGGLYWNTSKQYKNAIPNELFVKAAAELHNRTPGDSTYLNEASSTWQWFRASGMINSDNLINDGLDNTTCQNNNGTTWTYNQGVILGGLADLYRATHDTSYLTAARTLADASTRSTYLNPHGVLTEPCEADGCGNDGPTFKGVYVRNLGELDQTLRGRPYEFYLVRQALVSWLRDRNPFNQYGVHWSGPITDLSAAAQGSALDAQVAPLLWW